MKIEFLTKEQAREYFNEMDEYALNLKKTDLQIMNFNSKEEYFESFKDNFLDFTNEDKEKYKEYLNSVVHLNLSVKLIKIKKTHNLDLFQTRKESIIIPTNAVENDSLLVHEVFHIMSRKYDFSSLYNILGFKKYKEEKINDDNQVTNPDCVKNDYSIKLKINNEEKECIPYLAMPFLKRVKVVGEDNTYDVGKTNFQELFPLTQYLAHPEEICAEHFAFKFTGSPLLVNDLNYKNELFFNELESLMKKYNII